MATGRTVLSVAHDSFALTLYTHWHLEQRRRLDLLARKSERFDLAGLMAAAQHEPSRIADYHATFMASLRAPSAAAGLTATEMSRERQIAVLRAAHAETAVVVPLELS